MAEQKQRTSGTLPKNIRQIGTSIGSTRIYLEDYVYTYLHTQEVQETWTHRGFMLLGRVEKGKDYTRYFISGLIRVEDEFFNDHLLQFSDETWTAVYKEMKQYYDNLEIVGWGQDVSNAPAGLTAELERNHKQNFNIQKNVLFLMDLIEKEEAFYIFEKNMLQRREGYYVYYEKNPQMQEYMIEKANSRELNISPDEIREPLVHSYRETLLEKKAQLSERKWNGVLYTTSLLLVLSVCVLGVSTVNNVEKMQNLESTVNRISGQGGQAGQDVPAMSANVQDGENADFNAAGSNRDSEDEGDAAKGKQTGADDSVSGGQESDTGASSGDGQKTETDKSSGDGQKTETDRSSGDGQKAANESSGDGQKAAANGSSGDGQATNKSEGDEQKKGTGEKSKNSGDDSQGSSGSNPSNQDSGKGSGKDADNSNDSDDSEQASSDHIDTSELSEAQTSLLQGYYVVKKGDSLVGISKKIYGTAAKARKICELNGIDDMDKIYAGQRLELP